jgi:hypothetical protein
MQVWTISFHFIGQNMNIWLFNWALILINVNLFPVLGNSETCGVDGAIQSFTSQLLHYIERPALQTVDVRKSTSKDWNFTVCFPTFIWFDYFCRSFCRILYFFVINIYTGSNAFIRVFLLASQCSQDSPATKEETQCILKCIGLGTQMESILLWDWKSVSVCVCII